MGWYGNVHIHCPPTIKTPPWASHERLNGLAPDYKVLTDCCCCRVRADETVCTIIMGHPAPLGSSNEELMDWVMTTGAGFYDPEQRITCGPGFGCNVRPRMKCGATLRRQWSEY